MWLNESVYCKLLNKLDLFVSFSSCKKQCVIVTKKSGINKEKNWVICREDTGSLEVALMR